MKVPTPKRAVVALPAARSLNIPYAAPVGFITLNIVMLPAAMWLVAWCMRSAQKTGANSNTSMRKAVLAAMMVNSWVWYAYLYISHIVLLRTATKHRSIGSHRTSHVSRDFLSPYIQHSYNMLGALAVIHLTEFVFLMCYYKGISCHGKRQKRCKAAVSACGAVGVVLFVQMVSGYSLYFFLLLMVKPIYAIDQLSLTCSLSALVFLLTIMGILPCISRCKDLTKHYAVLLPLMSIFSSITILATLLVAASWSQVTENMDMLEIISTILTSCLIGTMGYTSKRVLLPHLSQGENSKEVDHEQAKQRDSESKPLIPKV